LTPKKIAVRLRGGADRSYDIIAGIPLARAGKVIRKMFPGSKIFIVTDSNVSRSVLPSLLRSFPGRSAVRTVVVPAGERSKTRRSKEMIEDRLVALGADRNSAIVALGGGMIGDLAGFVASSYMRGIPYVQIPTSLLGQVDSSVGGKVAVDHPAGKNLIGAFYQPRGVLIDAASLDMLPQEEIRNGMAEVIKYAAILDRRLFAFLEKRLEDILARKPGPLIRVISRCCELKASIVAKDEHEHSLRRILNFGHTIGHAVERLSRYRISHGRAVAIGMVAEARMSAALKMLPSTEVDRLERLVHAYGLPTRLPVSMDPGEIIRATATDKKSRNGQIAWTLLSRCGKAQPGILLTPSRALRLLRQ
jgi:3-dehydroquinate synthase